jgi:ADP-ribosylglycohydrolase
MRVSPVGFAFSTLADVLAEATKSAEVTHNHREGIKGARAIAVAIYLARQGETKDQIRKYIERTFGYYLDAKLDDIRPQYSFDETCQGSVPQAIIAFLESENYEDAVRKAISLGGDSDTLGCMAGGIAQAYYKHVPNNIVIKARELLNEDLLEVIDEFNGRFGL